MTSISFLKMHGLGNDFVIIDGRRSRSRIDLTPEQIVQISDRHRGVGCDQLVTIESPRNSDAPAFVTFFNADGSESGACGNATRCVAWLLMQESGADSLFLETRAGLLKCERAGAYRVRVYMGVPKMQWRDVPLSQACDTLHVPLTIGDLSDGVAVNMGNPHVVFRVPDVDSVPLVHWGSAVEHHPLFPERVNVEVVQIIDRTHLKLRVWERGAGETLACGSGACATLVAMAQRDLCERKAEIALPGGVLEVQWLSDGMVTMTGDVARVFNGVMEF